MVSNSWWMSMRVRGGLVALAVGVGVLALSARAAPAASVGHSGWFWGNPLPQGNTLSGIDFAGARGYAAGAFGTVLRTDDGGGSWTGISTGITADLVRVRAIDANTVSSAAVARCDAPTTAGRASLACRGRPATPTVPLRSPRSISSTARSATC